MGGLISDRTRIYLVYTWVRRFFWGDKRSLCALSAQMWTSCKFSLGNKLTAAARCHLLKLEGALESGAGFRHETRGVDSTVPQVANFGQMGSMLLSLSPAKC